MNWLHRVPAGPKLLALTVLVTAITLTKRSDTIIVEALASMALYPIAGISLRILWQHLRAIFPFLLLISAFQVLTATANEAIIVCGGLLSSALLATLVTLTTKASEMLALFEKLASPLARFHISPARVALVLALTIRCIPLVSTAWQAASDAYRARGLRRGSWKMVIPVIVRIIRSADAIGDAITARSIDPKISSIQD